MTVTVLFSGVILPSSGGRLPPPPPSGGTMIPVPPMPPTPSEPPGPPAKVVPPAPMSPPLPGSARRSESDEQDKMKNATAARNLVQRMSISRTRADHAPSNEGTAAHRRLYQAETASQEQRSKSAIIRAFS